MDFRKYSNNCNNISAWLNLKEKIYFKIEEISKQRITYNTSLLPLSVLAWQIDPIQNRFILLGNKSLAIADTFDKYKPDATLFPEDCSSGTGFIRDLSWFPIDNSLAAIISNSGHFKLIDMNKMLKVDSFNLEIMSHCIKFDESGKFPFNVAVGTKSGLRYCDLKSGSQIHLLHTKFDVECIEHSSLNQNHIYTGLSNGKVLLWDLRKTSCPINQIQHPQGAECSVSQIKHSFNTLGSIIIGYKNGDLTSYSSTEIEAPIWSINTQYKGIFDVTTFGDIICPVREKILFIETKYGNIVENVGCDILISPLSIKMNSFNSEIFIFDSNYIGAILRFKPKNTEAEK